MAKYNYRLLGVTREQEIVEKRSFTSKTFLLGPNQFRRVCHAKPVHYESLEGDLRTIDITFTLTPHEKFKSQFLSSYNTFSTGFRADLNLEKMMGIRRGPKNQFEITPIILSLNRKEIPLKVLRMEQPDDYHIRHVITEDIAFLTKVHECYLRPTIEVKNQRVVDFYFLERIDYTGFTIENRLNKRTKEYVPTKNNEFVFRATDGKEFRIPKPRMWYEGQLEYPETLTPKRLDSNELVHRLFIKDGKLFYSKAPTLEGRIWLSSIGLDLLYIDSTATYYSGTNDGYVELTGATTWSGVHDATSGSAASSTDSWTNRCVWVYRTT